MVGFFWIDLVKKRIRVAMPLVRHNKKDKKFKWFMEEFGITQLKKTLYNGTEWFIPLNKKNVKKLIKLGFDTEPWSFNYAWGAMDRTYKHLDLHPDTKFLKVFQKEALQFMKSKNGRALIALDPGLGKTPTALAYIKDNPKAKPVLIVCPASVKEQWKAQYRRFVGNGKVEVLYGRDSLKRYEDVEAVVVNYDILAWHIDTKKTTYESQGKTRKRNVYKTSRELEEFIETGFQYLIIDESHYIKDPMGKTKAYKAMRKIANTTPYIVGLTGTPMENGPAELFNILEILRPDLYNNRWYFLNRYCGPENNGWGMTYKGATLTNELNRRLTETVMYRRKKSDVLQHLAAVQTTVIPIRLEKHREYLKYKHELEEDIQDPNNKLIAANKFEKLLQKSAELKMKDLTSFIDDQLYNKEKVVVFAWHKKVVDALMEKYGDAAVKIDGGVPSEKREEVKSEFIRNPKKKVFVGNIISAGTGLDGLQGICDTVIFAELTWKSTKIDQAIDRINRMGFKREIVFVYYVIAIDTIEEDLSNLVDKKRRIVDKVIDRKDTEKFDLLEELIKLDKQRLGD